MTELDASQLTSIGNTNGGSGNFFVGPAGNSTTSGFNNTAAGQGALSANTSGFNNTASGWEALRFNTIGSYNTAAGEVALANNTVGSANTAMGTFCLYENTTGTNNTANGANALFSNSTGSYNTASGYGALSGNTNGSYNTADGYNALSSLNSGQFDIALGYGAGGNLVTGSNDIYIGNPGVSTDSGIIRIGAQGVHTATYLAGTVYADGGGVDLGSDRNTKENFSAVNPRAVLEKVALLPVTQWNYKTSSSVEHLGPMAQDFHAAFGLNGADDKHISVVDEGGVALAAIQGLNQKVESDAKEKEAKIQEQGAEIERQAAELKAKDVAIQDLKGRLEKLERLVAEKIGSAQ